MEDTGFLNAWWRDLYTVLGLLSVAISLISLWIALVQIRKTASAFEASTESAMRTLQSSRAQFDFFLMKYVGALLKESEVYARSKEFRRAYERLLDIAEMLTYMTNKDGEWEQVIKDLRDQARYFEKLHTSNKDLPPVANTKWQALASRLSDKLVKSSTPFSSEIGNVV